MDLNIIESVLLHVKCYNFSIKSVQGMRILLWPLCCQAHSCFRARIIAQRSIVNFSFQVYYEMCICNETYYSIVPANLFHNRHGMYGNIRI